jgi:hypothetical protein
MKGDYPQPGLMPGRRRIVFASFIQSDAAWQDLAKLHSAKTNQHVQSD